jgi:hypothetical protein
MLTAKLDVSTGRDSMVLKIVSPRFDWHCTFITESTDCRNLFPYEFQQKIMPPCLNYNRMRIDVEPDDWANTSHQLH